MVKMDSGVVTIIKSKMYRRYTDDIFNLQKC